MARQGAANRSNGRLRVALAQVEPVLGDLRANLSLHSIWIRKAIRHGADLVVFPELSLTGYLLQDLVPEVALGLEVSGPLRPLFDLSRRIAIVAGFVEETPGHRYYNSALFLEGGRVRHVHRKVYLPTYGMFDEGRFFAAGDRLQAFSTRLGRIGLLICEDFWHPSSSLILAQDGADYLLVLSAGPTEGIDRRGLSVHATWKDLARVTAQMQTLYVIYANRIGFEDGINFSGGSCVIDPSGEMLAEGRLLQEELLLCDLPRSSLRRARTLLPLLRDERLPILAREVQRLLAVPVAGRPRGRR
ncbi:MAG: carbon-nitrogen hydrolase [Acidobacteria bacterium]|nr:carbon-nitrogen hydrolase [Acidobacteriota bacterium]